MNIGSSGPSPSKLCESVGISQGEASLFLLAPASGKPIAFRFDRVTYLLSYSPARNASEKARPSGASTGHGPLAAMLSFRLSQTSARWPNDILRPIVQMSRARSWRAFSDNS